MKAAAMRYADLLENGCFITHHEQDDIAKLLRKLVMTEDEAWDELERKQNKTKALAQPEQEFQQEHESRITALEIRVAKLENPITDHEKQLMVGQRSLLRTASVSKPWVSLTDDEAYQLLVNYCDDDLELLNAIEAALRSKNNE